jgi:hypothetical protein
MREHGAGGLPGTQLMTHHIAVEKQGRAGAPCVPGRLSVRHQGPVGDANRRNIENPAELNRQSSPAGMIASSRVYEQYVRTMRQGPNRGFEEGPFPEREQPRLVGRVDGSSHDVGRHRPAADALDGGRPAVLSRPVVPCCETNEDGADQRPICRRPRIGLCATDPTLQLD